MELPLLFPEVITIAGCSYFPSQAVLHGQQLSVFLFGGDFLIFWQRAVHQMHVSPGYCVNRLQLSVVLVKIPFLI